MKNTAIVVAMLAVTSPMQVLAQDNGINEAVAEAASDAMEAVEIRPVPPAYPADYDYDNASSDPQFDDYIQSRFVQIDYPPEAVLAGEEGAVTVELAVDADGNANSCEIIETSGFERLDAATCPHVLSRATFLSAKDKAGEPVAGVMKDTVYWRVRKPEFDEFSVHFAFTQTAEGETEDCELISFTGTAPKGMDEDDPCKGFGSGSSLFRDENGVPVGKRVEITIEANASDLTDAVQDGE